MKRFLTKVLAAIGMSAFAAGALAQAGVSAPYSPLGSPAELVGRYSTNYAEQVRAALPKVDSAALAKLMEGVRAAAANQKPLAISNARELEKFFSLRERGQLDTSDYVDVGEAVYKLDSGANRIYIAWRVADWTPVARKTFSAEIPAIRSAHEALASRLGIPRQEVMFVDFREMLSQTDGHPVLEKGVRGEIQSDGATTTLLRAVGGVLVEGSYVRISSVDAKRLALIDIRWPNVRLSEAALKEGVRAPEDVVGALIKRVEENAGQLPVNVRMAVVLRPINPAKPNEFVPALKIGVEPKSIQTETGYRTDAGEIFFSDLVRGAPPVVAPIRHDTNESVR